MSSILEKYSSLRPQISSGDLILFHGTGITARLIQSCDNSYFNHVGIVVESYGALFIVDSNSDGVQADRLSWRVKKYKGGDFSVLKPLAAVGEQMKLLLQRSDEKWIRYDFFNGFKELLNRKFNLNLPIYLSDDRDICSSFVSAYAIGLEMVAFDFLKRKIAFPQDYFRYMKNAKLIG